MAILVRVMKIHIGNVINRPPRQNAPMFRVLTSFILKGIDWGFRKYMSTKIPSMVHQGLLAPQGLLLFLKKAAKFEIVVCCKL